MVKTIIHALFTVTALLVSIYFPMTSYSGLTVKFRHLQSIYTDAQGFPLKNPEGVAFNEKSQLWVADTGNGRLLRYTFRGDFLEWETQGFKVPQLSYPSKMEMDQHGRIYSQKDHRLDSTGCG